MAELPRRVELVEPLRTFDPDQLLIDSLPAKDCSAEIICQPLPRCAILTTDSASKWLVLERLVSEEQLHQTFVEVSQLPATREVSVAEVYSA